VWGEGRVFLHRPISKEKFCRCFLGGICFCSWKISTSALGIYLKLLLGDIYIRSLGIFSISALGGTYFYTCLWEISSSVSRRLSIAACLKGLLQLLLGNFYSRSSGIFSTSAPGGTSFCTCLWEISTSVSGRISKATFLKGFQ
jgi:hypothetical protein